MKLCDTSVLVDIDRGGIDEKVRTLDEQGRHAISMVTVTELRLGVNLAHTAGTDAHRQALDELDRLFSRFEIVPISRPVATEAADIIAALRRDGSRIDDLHDVYIAATARTEKLPLLTDNTRHFDRVDDVQVIPWSTFG